MTDAERPGSGAMFDKIAHRYDLLNRVMSLGLDRRWRRRAIHALTPHIPQGGRVLDLATGTGDVALSINDQRPDIGIVGVDPSSEMLEIARAKGGSRGIDFRLGDAQSLEFADDSFDGVVMSFGIRNVPDRPQALREIFRVLSNDGRLVVLELSEPKPGWRRAPGRFYVRHVVPRLGALLSGAKEYRYLQTSIAAFPPPQDFAELLTAAGFAQAHFSKLLFGVGHIYHANKPSKVESA